MGILSSIKEGIIKGYTAVKSFVVEKWAKITQSPIVQAPIQAVKTVTSSLLGLFNPKNAVRTTTTATTPATAKTAIGSSALLLGVAGLGALALL